jgi:hypothetical protein
LAPAAWALALSITGATAGCSGLSDQFFIVQNQVPEKGCVIPATKGIYQGSGYLDVALVSNDALVGYELFPLLQNDLPARGQAGATEPNRLSLREFHVRLEPGPGAPQELVNLFAQPALAPFLLYSVPWSGSVAPAGGNTAASVTVVPAEVARQMNDSGLLDTLSAVPLTVRVRAVGDTLTDTLESREFVYPIAACKNCFLQSVAWCPVDPVMADNVCNIAQDYALVCKSS